MKIEKEKMSPTVMAQYLTLRFQNDGIPLTPLKLQKLLYYIQAWHTVLFKKDPLFNEEPEAWVSGPAYRSVYAQYRNKFTKNTPIFDKTLTGDSLLKELATQYNELPIKKEQKEFLEVVIKKYGYLPDERLVYFTHIEKPWNEARSGLDPFAKSTKSITTESMYSYYSKR